MNAPLPNITPLLERGENWCYSAICCRAPDEFEAFICTPDSNHSIGTFTSRAEAQEAVNQVKVGQKWELEGIRETGPNEFKAVVRGPRGTYTIGTFETAADAEQAIKDVLEARWNG